MLYAFCTRKYLDETVLPKLEAGLDAKGKNRDDFKISGREFVVTGKDDDAVNRMFEWVRMRVGFYGSTPSYWPVLEAHGWQNLGHKLNDMSKKGLWQQMTKDFRRRGPPIFRGRAIQRNSRRGAKPILRAD